MKLRLCLCENHSLFSTDAAGVSHIGLKVKRVKSRTGDWSDISVRQLRAEARRTIVTIDDERLGRQKQVSTSHYSVVRLELS